jgi:hypothetical protein
MSGERILNFRELRHLQSLAGLYHLQLVQTPAVCGRPVPSAAGADTCSLWQACNICSWCRHLQSVAGLYHLQLVQTPAVCGRPVLSAAGADTCSLWQACTICSWCRHLQSVTGLYHLQLVQTPPSANLTSLHGHSPILQTKICSASPQIVYMSCNIKINYHIHNSPPLALIPSQINPAHKLQTLLI